MWVANWTGSSALGVLTVGRLLDRKRQLPPRRQLIDRDRGHPLHPPVTTPMGRHEPHRKAVPRIERHSTEPGRDQQTISLVDGEAAIVARQRPNIDAKARPPTPTLPRRGGGR